MRKLFGVPFTFVIIVLFLQVSPACAQATRTWVSGVGDDANPCSRTAPCKTFAGAISKTVAGGEINCLDPGGFGALTITKSITISCDNTESGVLVSGTNGITVSAAATDVVTLTGLDFQGLGTGLIGVSVVQAASVSIRNCRISGFKAGAAAGIVFAPPAGTTGLLFVSDTIITGNGTGILMQPAGSGVGKAALIHMTIQNNTTGIQANGSAGTGSIQAMLTDSIVSGNSAAGVHAVTPSGGASADIFANRVESSSNGTGYLADGGAAGVLMNNSVAYINAIGVSAVNSGSTYTYKNNAINGNTTSDGTPTNQLSLQ